MRSSVLCFASCPLLPGGTDNESAIMLSSHGTIQGYNGQALVDSKKQIIVHAEAFGSAEDSYLIPPMVDGAKENMRAVGRVPIQVYTFSA